MPVFQLKQLRRDLGFNYVRDIVVGTTTLSVSAQGAVVVLDTLQANPDFSGQSDFQRAHLRVASFDYRVASMNFASGAFVSTQLAQQAIFGGPSAMDYEVHRIISPADKDRAINDTILEVAVRREVGLPGVAGAAFYAIDNAASPNTILDVLNVYAFADPTNTANRNPQAILDYDVVLTPTGNELRISPTLGASQQIVLDALLQLSMGAGGDAATVNLPDGRWVLAGAAARCYRLLEARSPGQEAQLFRQHRIDAEREFTRLSARFQPQIDRRVHFDLPDD